MIGTKFSRPDFILSTGRFQESYISYDGKSFSASFGRANFFDENFRPAIFAQPVNGDGFSWKYASRGFAFKHVLESLPAEKSEDVVFRRLFSYHHLEYQFGRMAIGAGEYFILTGNNIGLEFKRLNPFLPFSLNSHDSQSDNYPGYTGDSDNALIKLFLNWSTRTSSLYLNLYIDEFQMDAADREYNNDAILLNLNVVKVFESFAGFNLPWSLESTLSLANPNFGQHPGPFTTTTSAHYPLFEYSPGQKRLFYIKSDILLNDRSRVSISFHKEQWVNIASLSPELRNQKTALQGLTDQQDSRIVAGYQFELEALHAAIELQAWWTSIVEEHMGANVSLVYRYTH